MEAGPGEGPVAVGGQVLQVEAAAVGKGVAAAALLSWLTIVSILPLALAGFMSTFAITVKLWLGEVLSTLFADTACESLPPKMAQFP